MKLESVTEKEASEITESVNETEEWETENTDGNENIRILLCRIKASKHYTISDESSFEEDKDDSDADPNFSYDSDSSESLSSVSSVDSVEANSSTSLCKENENNSELEIGQNKSKQSKSRVGRPDEWRKTKARLLRNAGKEYESVSRSQKRVKARQMRPPCGEKCRIRCSSKIWEEQKIAVF